MRSSRGRRWAARIVQEAIYLLVGVIAVLGYLVIETHGFTAAPQWLEAWQIAGMASKP